jgi:aminopeptidase N
MKARSPRPSVAVLLGLAIAALSAAPASAQAPTPGLGMDVVSYEVRLRPYFLGRSVSGETTISVRSLQDGLSELAFSGNALTVDSATVDGRTVRPVLRDGAWVVPLPQPVARGRTAVLKASYHGAPKRGLLFRPRSMHASYWACDWMLCLQDRPGDKARFSLALELPPGMTSIGPGRKVVERGLSSGDRLHQWRETRPYSPYLFAFSAGDFARAEGRAGPVELAYLSDAAPASELPALFAPTADMLRWFENKAGVPFPHARYAQVLTTGSAAQEAASHALIGRAVLDPILKTPGEDWVIAHELAHQWWGNLVTSETWSEFWLNEGITTFMVAAWKEHRWGRAAYDREMELARHRRARAAETGHDKPLSWAGEYPDLGTRRAIQYSKGALFMDALRTELGDAVFWAGLTRYTRAHAGGIVTSRDLQRAFEAEAGRSLQPLFDAWVYDTASA